MCCAARDTEQMKSLLTIMFTLCLVAGCGEERAVSPSDKMERFLKHVRKQKIKNETRWSLTYHDPEIDADMTVSKFMLGDASISVDQLRKEWPEWTQAERLDFANNVGFADASHLPDFIRLIMADGDMLVWSAIALNIVNSLPPDEALPFLLDRLRDAPFGEGANFVQALAAMKTPDALEAIQDRLVQCPR